MRSLLCAAALAACVWTAIPAVAAEATFEHNLTFSGRADLTIATGAGQINLTAGPAGEIHIVGHVRSTWDSSVEQVREVAAHPPIEQTGSIVRIGGDRADLRHLRIDYDITAPPDSYLKAKTGSGNVTIGNVGLDARLNTGAGNIHATGLRGGFEAQTGAGNIYVEMVGTGDVKAQTGTGNIELHGVDGAARADTGFGNISVAGKPEGPWKIVTGTGNAEVWTGGSAFTLAASCGIGNVDSDVAVAEQNGTGRHSLHGRVNGGGPLVSIATGIGNIRIH